MRHTYEFSDSLQTVNDANEPRARPHGWRFGLVALLAGALGCGPGVGSTTSAGEGTGLTEAADGSTSEASGLSATSTSGASADTTEGDPPANCSIYLQDCPPRQKCVPYTNGFPSALPWNDTKCVDVARNPNHVGDPCTAPQGFEAGIDDCDATSICYPVDVGRTTDGYCVAMCSGTEEAPVCDTCQVCLSNDTQTIALCTDRCSPFGGPCSPPGSACYALADAFACIPAGSGLQGDECDAVNACDPGLGCFGFPPPPGCAGDACCTPYCDLGDPKSCDGATGTTCAAVVGSPPPSCPGADVGACL